MRKLITNPINYFVKYISDIDSKKTMSFSITTSDSQKAIDKVTEYIDDFQLHGSIDYGYSLRVRKLRIRDQVDYRIPVKEV